MKTNCPNKSHPDFKKLVEEFGELDATYAYFLNDEDIPSVDVAGKLLKKGNDSDKAFENFKKEVELEVEVYQQSPKIYYASSGLGKSELVKQNPDKYVDLDILAVEAVKDVIDKYVNTKTASQLLSENTEIKIAFLNKIKEAGFDKIFLGAFSDDKLSSIGLNYQKYFIPEEKNVKDIIKRISNREENFYVIDEESYKSMYLTPFLNKQNKISVPGYLSEALKNDKPIIQDNEATFAQIALMANLEEQKKLNKVIDVKLSQLLMEYLKPFGVKFEAIERVNQMGYDNRYIVDTLTKLAKYHSGEKVDENVTNAAGHLIFELIGRESALAKLIVTKILRGEASYKQIKQLDFDGEIVETVKTIDKFKDAKNDLKNNVNYQKEDGSLDENKVAIYVAGQIISDALKRNHPKSESFLEMVYQKVSAFLSTIFGNRNIDAIKDSIMKEAGSGVLAMANLADKKANLNSLSLLEISDFISASVLLNKKEFLDISIPENYVHHDFEKSLKESPELNYIHNKLKKDNRFGLTGSVAFRKTGTVYRPSDEIVHDIDYKVSYELSENYDKVIKDYFPNAIPYHGKWHDKDNNAFTVTYLIPIGDSAKVKSYDTDYKESTDATGEKDFMIGNVVMENENDKFIAVDFFIPVDDSLKAVFEEGVVRWDFPFLAKLNYARAKDLKDFRNFVMFNQSETTALLQNNKYVFGNMEKEDYASKPKPTAIWGMATTGKTFLTQQQPDKYIDFDTYLKPVKKEIKQLYKEDKVAEAEALIITQWKAATEQAKKEGKQLLGSQQALLSSEEDVIDEIYYNDNYDDFRNKILNRDDEESTSEDDIKSRFDSNIDRINKYSGKAKKNATTKYLSELFDKEVLPVNNIRSSFESPRIKPLEAVLAKFNINNGITSVPANRLIVDGLINEQYMLANEVTIDDLAPLFIDQIMNNSTSRSRIEKYFPKNFNESSLQVRKEILTNMLNSNKAFNKEFIKQVIEIMNSKGMNVNEYTLLSDIIGKHNDIRYMSDYSESATQSVSPIYGTLPMNKQTEIQRKISELFMKTDSMFDSKNPYIEIDVSTMTRQEKKELADVIKGAKTITRYRLTNEKDGRIWVLKRVTDLQKKLSNKYKSAKEIEEQEEKSSIYADTGTILHTIMEDTILNSLTKFDDKIYAMFIDTLNNLKSLTDSSLSDISEKIYAEMLASKDYQTIRNNFLNSDKSPFASFYYYKDTKTGKMVRKDIKEYPAKNYNKIAESSVSAYIDILSRQAIKDWKNNSSKPINEQVWNRANIFTERRSFDEKESEVGTMDFLAVYSDGNYGIMDYKFMKAVMKITEDSNGKKTSQLNTELLMDSYFRSKEQAYSNQLSRYSEMMKTVYKGKDLEFARINPTYIGYSLNDQGKVDSNSKIINLFMSDEVSGLIPISKERTGNRSLDLFLDEIEKQTEIITNDLSKRKAWTTDFITVNRLTELKKILMSIQSRGDLSGYTHYAMDFIKNVNKTIKNKPESLTNKALNNITDELAFISYFLNNTSNIMIDYKEKYPDEYDRFASQISSLFVNLSEIKTKLDELKVSRLREEARKLGMLDSVFDSYKDASDISGAQNMLLTMKSINHPLVQVFSKKLDVLNAQRIALQKRIKEDHDVYYESLKKWGESRGLKGTDIYKPMLTDNKQLITPYSSKYKTDTENYKDLSNEENLIWWKANFHRSKESFNGRKSDEDRFQEAKKHHREKLEIAYSEHDDKVEKINGLMDSWSEKNDIYNPKFNNWYECYYKSPINRDKYLSDAYLNIMKPENKPLRDYYEYLIKMNEQFKAMMGGDVNINYNFVPNIRKSMLDTASQDALGGTGIFKNYWDSISNSIMRNPEDKLGDNTKEIPILFIDFIDVESKSIDLGKNLMMFGTFVNQYKHAKELLEISNMIEYTLINTPLAVKDKKGNKLPSMSSSSNFETVSGANSNLVKAIQTYRDYYMYGETTKRDAVSEVLGDKGVRLVQAAQSKVSSMSMSFNFVSATVGSLNARTQIATIASAGKYFTDKQFANAMKITETFSAKLMWADLFFEANGDSTNTVKKANELSANSLVRNFSENYGYWYQRYVDNLDEKVLLHAMLNNYGIDPNTGVTVRLEKLEEKYGKDPKYTGVKFKSIWESIELIDENDKTKGYRIVNQHTGKPIEIVMETGSELEEETNTQNTNTFISMRRKVMEMNSRIRGAISKEDMSSFRMSVVGRLLGQFRNWMPATLNERLKKEQYNMTMEEFEVGRWTSLYNVGKTNFTNTAKQFLVALIPFRNHSFDAIDTPVLRARYDQFIQNNPGVKDLVSYDDFVKEYKGQLRTFARELKFYGMIFLLGMILVSMLKGSGDDEEERGFILNSFSTLQERLQMELGFYIPIAGLPEFLKLATKDPFPIVRGITDSLKLITNTADETRDIFVGENYKNDKKPLFHFTSRFLGVGNVARYSGLTDTTNDNDSLGEWLFGGKEHGKI